jgi:aryl-alcohol dehydrogenase-like predicted oxidoreductase
MAISMAVKLFPRISFRCTGEKGRPAGPTRGREHRVDLVTEMTYRRLGDSGLVVSVVGVGCNNFGRRLDAAGTRAVVDAALDVGINFFDTADIYGEPHGGSEEQLGAALRGRRDDVVLATKFGMDMSGMNGPDHGARGARRYLVRAAEASLRRLGTDHIDLYQLHEPDPGTPIDETLSALDDLVRAGKVRYLGNSNFTGWQIADAAWTARTRGWAPFISAQNHYSLLHREVEAEVVPAAERFGLGLLPFFPLADGLLTGKYKRGAEPPSGSRLAGDSPRYAARLASAPWDTIEAIERYAAERGLSVLDVAIGGLAAQPAVTSVIAGATTPDQVRANANAGRWQPSPEDRSALRALL